MRVIQSPSPNYSYSIYDKFGLQIHKTLGKMPWTLQWLQNPDSQASAHYLITKKGVIHQLVSLDDRAWTSGRINQPSARAKRIMLKTPNGEYVKPGNYLIEIEFECLEHETYTEAQYKAVNWLIGTWDFDLESKNLLTHQDTAIDKPNLEYERARIIKDMETQDDGYLRQLQLKIQMLILRLKLMRLLKKKAVK